MEREMEFMGKVLRSGFGVFLGMILLCGCGNAGGEGTFPTRLPVEAETTMEATTEAVSAPAIRRLYAVTVQFPDGGQQRTDFLYDHRGMLVSSTFSQGEGEAEETVYTYDQDGRLLSVQICGNGWEDIGPKWEYQYDAAGRLTEHTEREGGAGTCTYRYDDSGRCVEKRWQMDVSDRVSQLTYSEDGLTVEEIIRYEDSGEEDIQTSTYDQEGRLEKVVYTGTFYSYTDLYDYSCQPFTLVSRDGEGFLRLYLPDPVGHPIWEIEYLRPADLETDDQGYLTAITTDSGAVYRFLFAEE